MLSTNTNFDNKHDLDYKTPMYLIHFDGETKDYCNHKPVSPSNTLKQYLIDIRGNSQKVIPEEGKGSIGGVTVTIQDYNDEITALLATDNYFFHRRKTTIKAGYLGMAEADMLDVSVGWVTGLKLSKDGLSYIFDVTDPQKWLQRKIFRDASDSNVVTLQGNPLNIYLAVLISTGNGTNGDYDYLDESWGLGIDDDNINVTNIETVRDDYFPGDSHYMKFQITDKIKAKDFLETEILKVLNCYPTIDGDGKINITPFKPPIVTSKTVQSFSEDNIIGTPSWDANLAATINEIELHYNYDHVDDEFDNEDDYIDTISLNNRGPGKKPLVIKTKGLHTDLGTSSISGQRAEDVLERRKNRIFGRFATPPSKIVISCFFSRWLSEAGDIVPFTHSKLPDIVTGTRGFTAKRIEIIDRTIDWKKGRVKITLLDTGFDKGDYVAIRDDSLIKTTNLIMP